MKKKIAIILCMTFILASVFPMAAYAGNGRGHHNSRRAVLSGDTRFAICPLDECAVYGPHMHDRKWYCNQVGVNWDNYEVCAIEGCAHLGLHEHDGEWFHCIGYPYGIDRGCCGGRAGNRR